MATSIPPPSPSFGLPSLARVNPHVKPLASAWAACALSRRRRAYTLLLLEAAAACSTQGDKRAPQASLLPQARASQTSDDDDRTGAGAVLLALDALRDRRRKCRRGGARDGAHGSSSRAEMASLHSAIVISTCVISRPISCTPAGSGAAPSPPVAADAAPAAGTK